jgi:hypothetical protein
VIRLFLNEDGSMPGEPLSFLSGVLWFFITPVGIFLLVIVLVLAQESAKKSRKKRAHQDLITRINE